MPNILPKMEVNFFKKTTLAIENLNRNDSNLGFFYIFGLNKGLKDLADPPNLSPEIGATETMASLIGRVLNETKGVSWTRKVSKSKFGQIWIIFGHYLAKFGHENFFGRAF